MSLNKSLRYIYIYQNKSLSLAKNCSSIYYYSENPLRSAGVALHIGCK